MEIKELAERVLFSDRLEDKLIPGESLTDDCPGPGGGVLTSPVRPKHLQFAPSGGTARFPKTGELENESALVRLFHFFANHELLATELMALVLLCFPDAPKPFRRGVAKTLMEEQEHTKLYLQRIQQLGGEFGAYPVSGFFWESLRDMSSPLDYVTGLPLTFEQANLDFSQYYAKVFAQLGDNASQELMERIFRDEIGHVAYGLKWLRRLKRPDQTDWEAYSAQLEMPLSPRRAKGSVFSAEARQRCGFDDEFIRSISVYSKSRGRTPNVYYFNPFAEWEWAVRRRLTLTKRQREFQVDLENLLQYVGGEDDVVLVSRRPSTAWLEELRQSGFPVPQFETFNEQTAKLSGELSRRRVRRLVPWAWAPTAEKVLASLSEVAEPNPFSPSSGAENREPSVLFSKASALDLARAHCNEHGESSRLIPDSELGTVVADLAGANAVIERLRRGTPRKLVAKACFGAAGGRMLRLWEPELMPEQERWLAKRFEASEKLLIEPWHDRVFDFSAHFDSTDDGVRLRGFVQMFNDRRGQFAACAVGDPFTVGLDQSLKRWLHDFSPGGYKSFYRQLEDRLDRFCKPFGYRGPIGVDAYIYRSSEGELRLRPIVEINPRHTMGRITLGLRRFVQAGKVVTMTLLSKVQLRQLSLDRFSALPSYLEEHFPVAHSSKSGRRIEAGALCLTNAECACHCVAVLWVGLPAHQFVRRLIESP